MINIDIPGFGKLELQHALFDYNGTLAIAGILIEGIIPLINQLSEKLDIYVITGDSFGTAKTQLAKTKCTPVILDAENQAQAKSNYINKLGAKNTVAIGNGRNDQYMLKNAALSIVVLDKEGTALEAINAAMLIVPNVLNAIELLLDPIKLKSVLRS